MSTLLSLSTYLPVYLLSISRPHYLLRLKRERESDRERRERGRARERERERARERERERESESVREDVIARRLIITRLFQDEGEDIGKNTLFCNLIILNNYILLYSFLFSFLSD